MRMLVAVDVHDRPELVIAGAVAWAERLGARVDLAYASEWATEGLPTPPEPHDQLDALHAEWNQRADEERALLVAAFATVPPTLRGIAHLISGRPVDAIPDFAASYDLVIAATHARHGVDRVLLGSVTARLLRRATVPVLVLGIGDRIHEPAGPLRVVCPVDEGDAGAVSLASTWFPEASLDVVHVLAMSRWSPAWLERAPKAGTDVRRDVLRALISERIKAFGYAGDAEVHVLPRETSNSGDGVATFAAVNDTDLVVLPTHGRTGVERWMLGSVAERVAERAPCPVLVVPWSMVEQPD